ncbi:MAG: hypothetical protein LBK12_04650 [Odoribacteraceae bacterium]|jgi:hypothetical protein|nr:hypothetical protein [Odoribacteraceae bacterium]
MRKRVLILTFASCVAILAFVRASLFPQSVYTPVFMERPELEKSVFYDAGARELVNPGKIYHRAPYIYVNEKYKGVYVIDNTRPEQPRVEGFIVAPGCMDIAIKGDILYVDNAVDLVAFDLSTRRVTKRVKEVFPEPLSPDGRSYYGSRPDDYVLVGWKKSNR